ncbi:hypothetical protein PHYPSEUDO_008863 [Phytophthora pseudosyringae]|uniref:Uncharacterized protein n=1 Tax=Phytophthora pseudosyringae TaxID=221518 RepID=A0A8T1VD46_9STRA|nr:hypothetical protein PHYPSEUDO_008863 [Phytophthora pseudosyringae]
MVVITVEFVELLVVALIMVVITVVCEAPGSGVCAGGDHGGVVWACGDPGSGVRDGGDDGSGVCAGWDHGGVVHSCGVHGSGATTSAESSIADSSKKSPPMRARRRTLARPS